MQADLKKLQFLDALRGWAILLVLLVHSGGLIELFGAKLAFCNFGQRGVQLFYEVSAFSLLYSWYSRREGTWKAFFIRRFFRIAPLFYISMAAFFIYSVFIQKQPALTPWSYISGLLFLFGFDQSTINAVVPAGWSVAVESTFYLLFPLLVLGIRNLGNALAFAAVASLTCFLVCYRLPVYPNSALSAEYAHFLWFPVEFPVFCFGFVAFFFWRDLVLGQTGSLDPTPALRRPIVRRLASAGLLALGAWTIYASFPVSNYRLYLNSVSFIFIILSFALHPWRLFVNPITQFIGRMSYSIYLVHPYLSSLVSWVVGSLEGSFSLHLYGHPLGLLVTFVAYLTGSLLISLVTYPFVEKRGITFGKNLISRLWAQPERATESKSTDVTPFMDNESEIERLRARMRTCYALWALSLVATFALIFAYGRMNPEAVSKTEAQYRLEISEYEAQVQTLSASLLENQRALKNTEKDLQRATEAIKDLQSRPHG